MRQSDRLISDKAEINEILTKAQVCRVALSDKDQPYIVALNYGIEFGDRVILYFHCAPEGRKLDIIRNNNKVCFQVDTDLELVPGNKACKWSMNYRSVVGFGTVEILITPEEIVYGLNVIMAHYSDVGGFEYDEKVLKRTSVLKMIVTEMTGKQMGYNN